MSDKFSQIGLITLFGLRTIPQRKGSVLAAGVGIAGVVAVLVGVLSIAQGFRRAVVGAGREDVAIVTRKSAPNEMSSVLGREDVRLIGDAPGLARSDEGGAIVSAELLVIIEIAKRATGLGANVPFRGVGAAAARVRDDFAIVEGRMFEPGRNELIAGVSAAREFAGLETGSVVRLGRTEWHVVGLFRCGGGVAESELWTDAPVLQQSYQRGESYQAVYAALTSPGAIGEFKDALSVDPRLNVQVLSQREYLADQSNITAAFIEFIGWGVAAMMAVGAVLGAVNTMYNAVASRTREIATLRALGFGGGSVIVSVLLESMILAIVAGGLGALGAYLAFDGYTASTMNFQSWSQVAFTFRVTPELLAAAMILATVVGFLGGLLPAVRAARAPIAASLRET